MPRYKQVEPKNMKLIKQQHEAKKHLIAEMSKKTVAPGAAKAQKQLQKHVGLRIPRTTFAR